MARIPEHELNRLKHEISLQRLVESRGIQLNRHGPDLIGLCPFHDDKEPSLVISPKSNLWHCLGACQAGGSVIDWVMKAEGVSFRLAAEMLKNDSPSLAAAQSAGVVKKSTVPKLASPVEFDGAQQEQLKQVIRYYHARLKESPDALGYLKQRGLNHPEAIERFQLGFCDRTLGYRLPQKNRQAGAEVRGTLTEMGILRSSGHEHFRGSIVVPVLDETGAVVEAYGRKVTPNLRKGTSNHLYLPGPHRGVWNIEALAASDEIILCEALFDALTFWCAGYRNVTSSYGIEGFTTEHEAAFKQHGVKRVLIAYDRDDAGDKAAEKLAERLTSGSIDCYRVQFPRGMDANAYACEVQPAAKSLGVALRSAVWIGKGCGPSISVGVELPTSDGAKEPAAGSGSESGAIPEVSTPAAPLAADEPDACPPIATPEPTAPEAARVTLHAEVSPEGEEVTMHFGSRRWRIRGIKKNMSYEQLRVNVLCAVGDAYHVDTFDLYSARHRSIYIKQAAAELGVEERITKSDLGKVLLKLEELQSEQIKAALTPKETEVTLSDREKAAALELLKDPKLLERILLDYDRCGVVGEQTNKLVGYLAAVSRKLEEPLAVIVQSSSAAGKSALMESVLAFMPDEERVKYSAMTGQSLFYLGENDLKHKILAIVEEEGAERASYALKLLQSEGELTIASTGKDPVTGRLVTQEYRVEGPVMIFLTTTAIEIDDELLNRCLVLTVDEDIGQTRAIHKRQRQKQTITGLLGHREREDILTLHQNAQRMLRPMLVANPYAEKLTFTDHRTRTRRDHMKYLTLIRAVAFLHQYQRPVRTIEHQGKRLQYIEATIDDIAVAGELAHHVLGRSLDELPPQTRRLLMLIDDYVAEQCEQHGVDRSDLRFSRRDVREVTDWGNTQLKHHLHRLEELEYLYVHRGRRGQSFVYELAYDGSGKDGTPVLPSLIDPRTLGHEYDGKKSGFEVNKSGSSRPQVGGVSAPSRGSESAARPQSINPGPDSSQDSLRNHYSGPQKPVAPTIAARRSDSAESEATATLAAFGA